MKLSFDELNVVEKNFKNGSYLNDDVKYNSIIEMKRDLYELLNEIGIHDVFKDLYERSNYQIETWECGTSKILFKNLNLGSAKAIRNNLFITRKVNINLVDIVISWWANSEYHFI